MNKFQKGIISILVLGILSGAAYLYLYSSEVNSYKNIVAALAINDVDLAKVKDGTYQGSCDARFVAADVSVTVKNHKITAITLIRHKHDKGQRAEVMPQMVLKAQSLKVDTISGATNSSKVILKAIETALESSKQY
ncbi:MAG: FMN-binding protein [Pelosinus sp.]|nr:FMN-binding protein [Pelosinus sp.]